MKGMNILWFTAFINISFMITGLITVQTGIPLVSPYVDAGFLNGFTELANGFNELNNAFKSINKDNLFANQQFSLCIPFINLTDLSNPITNICSPSIGIPLIASITSILNATASFGLSFIGILLGFITNMITLGSLLYFQILMTVLPTTPGNIALAGTLSTTIFIIQLALLLYDLATNLKEVGFGAVNYVRVK